MFYTYDSGNKLLRVSDGSNHPEGFKDGANTTIEYGYDAFGNMTQDLNKGIPANGISYNHLNLPKQILFSGIPNRKINYLYNALGQKVEKKITNNLTESVTSYQGIFHYENDILKFFATAEGYVNVTTGGRQGPNGPSYVFNYVYNYTDHLGNIRLSYTNNGINAAIIEENHYYPFGLKHKKYGSVDKDLVCVDEDCYEVGIDIVSPQTRKSYQYKYNGQEFQDELGLNWYNYRYRNYDPAIGRFFGIDPVSEEYFSISTYQFAHNNPVWKIEIEGLEGEPINGTTDIINHEPIEVQQTQYQREDGKVGTVTISVSSNLADRVPTSNSHQQTEASQAVENLNNIGLINTIENNVGNSLENNSGQTRIGSNDKLYFETEKGGVFKGNQYISTKSLSEIGGKISSVTGPVGDVIDFTKIGISVYQDGGLGANTTKTAAGVLVGAVGAEAGAWAGAGIGFKLGGLIGPQGALVGAVAGAIVGGVMGAYYGGQLGENIMENYGNK